MLACLVLVPVLSTVDSIQAIRPTFILEAIALIAFGLSWLKKGKADFTYLSKKLGGKGEAARQEREVEVVEVG